jgi:hypothetical protein
MNLPKCHGQWWNDMPMLNVEGDIKQQRKLKNAIKI